MYATIASLLFLGLALAWTALNKSGIPAFDWYISLVLIGLAFIAFWSRPRRLLAPSLPKWLNWTICGILLYIIFQALPLPLAVLSFFSPERAELTRAASSVAGPISFAPIAVAPAAHILWFLTLAGCTAAFFLVRDFTFRLQNRLFLAALPLLVVATLEALLGLLQVAGGAEQAVGSYNSRDHYCCILEMTLPLSVSFGLLYWGRRQESASIWPVLQAVGCWLISGALTLAILASLSRAGWIDSLLSLIVISVLVLFPRIQSVGLRFGLLGSFLVLAAGVFLFASSGAMLNRLVSTMTPDSEGRIYIWRELVPLTRQFRWFGSGLMGFDTLFLKYQAINNNKRIDFAHDDFLQYLIELGMVGFVPLMVSLGSIIWPITENSWPNARRKGSRSENRILFVGCVASFSALFVHSLVDFNLYVPANVFAFAWILGFGSALAAISSLKPGLGIPQGGVPD